MQKEIKVCKKKQDCKKTKNLSIKTDYLKFRYSRIKRTISLSECRFHRMTRNEQKPQMFQQMKVISVQSDLSAISLKNKSTAAYRPRREISIPDSANCLKKC